ncbi:MAG: transposase, partial [Komagataeibacter hansenii]|nr:transposase [Novacetimonas hansenii]
PPRKNDPEVACPKWAYRHRHLVENLWARLKEWRAVATRYEKTAASFFPSSSSLLQQTISRPNRP